MTDPTRAPMSKAEWRVWLLAARRTLPEGTRRRDAERLAAHGAELAGPGDTVCAYAPVGAEPGSVGLLDALRGAGARVLLPIAGAPGPLDWAAYRGADSLTDAARGLRQPSGPTLGHAAIGLARTVLMPALAVARDGVRLGRGGGFYDRSLPLARPDARLVAVVHDAELVDALPADPHDVRVGWALTPELGVVGPFARR